MNALLLLSGGYDSAVAGYLVQKKDISVYAVHFSLEKITGAESIEKAKKISEILKFKKLFIFDASDAFAELAKRCEHRYYFVLIKRFMLKAAERLAEKNSLDLLVTGENLAQVSSQTLQNLNVIEEAVKLPLMRPLIALDKQEIIDLAKQIGTYEASTGKEMCDVLGPKKPSTQARLETIKAEEKKLDLEKLINSVLKI